MVFAGPKDGEPIVLLHGFPEFWFVWRDHIAILAEAGYRVAAPDLRGYNRSEKPRARTAYSTRAYASDITGLMDSIGWDSAHIVGHDIGGVVTWRLVFEQPDRVKSAVVFSVPHPSAVDDEGEKGGRQWYRTLFRTPVLPELLSRSVGLSMTATNLRSTSRPGTFTEEEVAVYKAAWDREHAFTTMIGYYRANHQPIASLPLDGRPAMPVMFVYGTQDHVIPVSRAEDTVKYLGEENVEFHPELSHWLLTEDPSATTNDIMRFIDRSREEPQRIRRISPVIDVR